MKRLLVLYALTVALLAQEAPSRVDTIIQLVQGGLTEELVIQTIQNQGQAYELAPADLLKLQQAGVSGAIIAAMMNPAGGSGAAAASASAPAAAEAAPVVTRQPRKRRLAVLPFDHAAVAQWVHYWFGGPHNIGEGIRAMLTARMHQAKHFVLVERAAMDALQAELALSNSSLVNQGTKVNTGRMSAADVILMGDITIFGRDDKTEGKRTTNAVFKKASGLFGLKKASNHIESMGQLTKEEKAVVAIALRIVDTETGEILETAEARGESSRVSKNWDQFVLSGGGSRNSQSEVMTSSNFQATIIGEATSNAVDDVIAILDERLPQMPLRGRNVEGRVAQISNGSPILAFGANQGVEVGDRFEILKILNEVLDPVTKEVLDVATAPAGELVVTDVRERISLGNYSGDALLPNYEKGYTARLAN